jgi:tetratricopeptide (TPR) repeat protein
LAEGPETARAQNLDLLEPLVLEEPGDDELRRRYIDTAIAVGAQIRAAETLKGSIRREKSGALRERVGLDIAILLLKEGELSAARHAFLEVVVIGAGSEAALTAARRVLELEGEPGDPQAIGAALEVVARTSPNTKERHDAAVRLLAMHATKPWKEARLAIAYEALVDSERTDEALAWLRSFYEKKADAGGLSDVYRKLASRTSDLVEGRKLALEAFRLAGDVTPEAQQERWLWFVDRFGPDREGHRILIPLLEKSERWVELSRVLEWDIALTAQEARADAWARLGELRLTRLGDVPGALAANARCLALDPDHATARPAVEGLMERGDHRLDAANVMEPIYKAQGSVEGELRVLEMRARLLPDESARLAMWSAALELAIARGLTQRALVLCRHAINADPSSSGLHLRYDQLVGDEEPPAERIARYEWALERATDVARSIPLLHTLAALRGETGDVHGAREAWRQILSHDPTDCGAHERLIDATMQLGETDAVLPLIERAQNVLQGRARDSMTLRKAVWLAGHGQGAEALELARQLIGEPLEGYEIEAIAEIAEDQEDDALRRHALELLVERGDEETRARALEQLGDFQLRRLGDRESAASSWKAAADRVGATDPGYAQNLYERALEALPDDREAAERLVNLYAAGDGWARLPDVVRLVAHSGDIERAAEYLLRVQRNAIEARAFEDFVALSEEILAKLPHDSPALPAVRRARARTLAADASLPEEAAAALRKLVEAYGEDEDLRAFEAFVETRPSSEERRKERRWLYAWRAARGGEQVSALLDWAKAEEADDEAEAAAAVYERVLALDPGREEALEAVCRWRFRSGDFAAGLSALSALRDRVDDAERPALSARVAEWLWIDLGRPGEAALALAPALAVQPPFGPAIELGRRLLADTPIRAEVVDRLESVALAVGGEAALPVLRFLITAREETSSMPGRRRRWFQRAVELSPPGSEETVAIAISGVLEAPDAMVLWENAEVVGKRAGRPQAVAAAYHRILAEAAMTPELAEALGQRMVSFEEACAIASDASVEALLRVLDAAPAARWAVDRVKLVLGARARWEELFGIYDRAIETTAGAADRAELLNEAAFAAKDLAGEPRRAIAYFEKLRALRPQDAAVDSALERLYERQGLKTELIALLERRAAETAGFKRRELRRRIVTLWLELGDVERGSAVLDTMLKGDATVADVVDLLERVAHAEARRTPAAHVAAMRAVHRLERHYAELGRKDDLVRIADVGLRLAEGTPQRNARARDWVRFVVAAERGAPDAFERVGQRLAARVGEDADLAVVAYKALLVHAMRAWRRDRAHGTSAANGAYRAAEELASLLASRGTTLAAYRLLHRASRLPFDRRRRRALVSAAAFACAEVPGAEARATRVFDELFDDDPADEVAAKAIDRFAALLDAQGDHARLAARWEEQARIHSGTGATARSCECWERAGRLWETLNDWARAVTAYREGAALGSASSYDALARIHMSRQQWSEAAGALEWLYDHARGADRHARALQLAQVYDELGQADRARAYLEEVLPTAGESSYGDAIRGQLIGLYRRDGVWLPLARLLSSEAQRVGDLDQKLALTREACEILESKLNDTLESTILLRRAVAWAPQDDALRSWLVGSLESLDQWDDAAEALRGRIALFGEQRSKDRAFVHHRLARDLMRAAHASEALSELRVAADMAPGQAAILYDLGRVALEVGDVDLSESTYRALLLALHRPAEEVGGAALHRPEVFLDLSEIALRRGDDDRATDLVDSAFDDALEAGLDRAPLEEKLAARGRYAMLAREEERCAERAATLAQRALAVGHWAELWSERLGRSDEVAERIRTHAQRLARDLDQEHLTEPGAWAALVRVEQRLHDPATRDRLCGALETAIGGVGPGGVRSALRVSLARLFGLEPVRDDAAIAVLQGALEDDPGNREAADMLSDSLEREGRFDELVSALEGSLRALSAEGDPSRYAAALLRLGRALEQAGRKSEALGLYESVLDHAAPEAQLLSGLSVRLASLGSARLADCLERWLAVDPTAAPRLAPRLVELRDLQGDREGLERALEAAITVDRKDAALRDRLIAAYAARGDWQRAADVLRHASEAAPGDRDVFRRLVDAYERAGATRDLSRALDAALSASPDDAEWLSVRARVRESLDDIDGAVSDLEGAAAADASHAPALLELLTRVVADERRPAADGHVLKCADLLLGMERPADARAVLERLRARAPKHREVLRRLAQIAVAEQDWGVAADAFRELLQVVEREGTPEDVLRVATSLVQAYERAGRMAEARVLVQRPFDLLSDSPSLFPKLEALCEAVGDFSRLQRFLVRRADAASLTSEKVELWLRATQLALDHGADPLDVLPVVDQARAAAPDSVEVALVWARAHVALGRTREALQALGDAVERCRSSRPLLAAVYLQIAKAQLADDDLPEALEALKAGFATDWRTGEIAMLLGLVAMDLDDDKTAERALIAVTTMPPRKDAQDAAAKAIAFEHLAAIAHARGDTAKAKLLITKAAGFR